MNYILMLNDRRQLTGNHLLTFLSVIQAIRTEVRQIHHKNEEHFKE